MPKVPYKTDKKRDDEDDYEIVSFEDFCDKSPGSKTDLLTLNDNINYRLCYEHDKAKSGNEGEGSGVDFDHQTETSLNDPKSATFKRKMSNSFAPFGRGNSKGKGSLFGGVVPKPRNEGESTSRYQRFSNHRNFVQRVCENLPTVGSGMLGMALVLALCVGVWWAVSGALGGSWGEEHYRKLWERTHPDNIKKPLAPIAYEKINISEPSEESKILPDNRYHDHSNLSTKNKLNNTDHKKKDHYKKNDYNLGADYEYTERPPHVLESMCSQITDDMRFDCFPQGNANEKDCVDRGCCWKPTIASNGIPFCYYPSHYDSFRFVNMTEDRHGIRVYYEKLRPSGYADDFDMARLDIKYTSDDVLEIRIYDPTHMRFEPPYPVITLSSKPLTKKKYRVQLDSSALGFKIIRTIDNVTVINTQNVGGLILSNKFLQMSAILSTDRLYGLGERRARFKVDMNYKTRALFNRDRAPVEDANLYGTHPFYMGLEDNGMTHGMLLLNSNAMDIVLQPTPGITYRTTGGIFHFYVFMGHSPNQVMFQYTEIIGRPFLPPYWALGFHLCKFNYGSLNVTKEVWQKNRDAGIPFDVQWNDIDYMKNNNDFTYDPERFAGLPQFVDKLHSEGMKYMMILDPGISASEKPGTYPPYDRGIDLNIFIKNSTNQPLIGKVWNAGTTVWPDFTHPNSTDYWLEMMRDYHKKVNYDGAWIDMNEPSNFVNGIIDGACKPENLTYMPQTGDEFGLKTKTLCMDAQHYYGPHFDYHNLYGFMEAVATNFALTDIRGKRPFIISRSSFVGMGRYAGHWSGDIASDWHDMRMSIPELLSFSLFGIPMMGADICGFRDNTTVELCKRWMQLGAFYPFSRNHNSDTSLPQDPVSLGPAVVEASRKSLRLRYALLPLYYTQLWRAHTFGDTVVRPLFFQAPQDTRLHDIDTQFLIGPNVMVTPILHQGVTVTKALFPGPQRWYNIRDGQYIGSDSEVEVDEDQTVSVRGGAILILQEPPRVGPVTTTNTRSSPLQLLIAPDNKGNAFGELYWDDGDSIYGYQEKKCSHVSFLLKNTELRSQISWWGYGIPSINKISIIVDQQPAVKTVSIDNVPCAVPHCDFAVTGKTPVLQIFNINLLLGRPFNVTWTYKSRKSRLRNTMSNNINDTFVEVV